MMTIFLTRELFTMYHRCELYTDIFYLSHFHGYNDFSCDFDMAACKETVFWGTDESLETLIAFFTICLF